MDEQDESIKPALYMVIASFFFVSMQVCIKMCPDIPFYQVAFFRGLFAFIITPLFIWRKPGVSLFGKNKTVLFLRGFFGSIALLCFFYTVTHMPLASAVTIQYLSPIFTVLIAIVLFKEYPTKTQMFMLILAFIGVAILKGFSAEITYLEFFVGIIAALGAACAYNMIRKLGDEDPMVVIFYFPLVLVPTLLPYVLLHGVEPSLEDWFWLVMVGVFTQCAQYVMTMAYQLAQASKFVIFSYIGAAFASIAGWLLFDEVLNLGAYLGICIVILSAVMTQLASRRAVRRLSKF